MKRPAIGKGQTRVGDRLQPSLTAPSMFNAVGQTRGRARAAPLAEEVSSGAFRLGETAGTLEECDRGLPHKWSIGRQRSQVDLCPYSSFKASPQQVKKKVFHYEFSLRRNLFCKWLHAKLNHLFGKWSMPMHVFDPIVILNSHYHV